MSEWLKDLLSSVPDSIASPITKWHESEIERENNRWLHEERMQRMEHEHEERMVNKKAAIEYMKTLQTAMQTGYLDRNLGECLMTTLRLTE